MPIVLLVIVFIAVPVAELWLILQVAEWLGGGFQGAALTILLLVIDSFLGAILLRSQGRSVWRRFNAVLAEGRVPHREVVDGVLVIFGGALLLTPGFISDVVGAVLLIPPTRAIIRPILVRRLTRKAQIRVTDTRRRPPQDFDVEGSATEYEPPPARRLER